MLLHDIDGDCIVDLIVANNQVYDGTVAVLHGLEGVDFEEPLYYQSDVQLDKQKNQRR